MTIYSGNGGHVNESTSLSVCWVPPPPDAEILATATVVSSGTTAALAFRTRPNAHGGSMVFVGLGNYGVATAAQNVPPPCQQNRRSESPYPLAASFARLASDLMAGQALFDIGGVHTNLSWVVKSISETEYMLGVSNTQLDQQLLTIVPTFGSLESIDEVSLDDGVVSEPGYLPHGFSGRDIGESTNVTIGGAPATIAGADFRMFKVCIAPSSAAPGVKILPHTIFPRAPNKIWLRIGPRTADLVTSIESRPGFRQLFSGVLLDSSYVSKRSVNALQADAKWMLMQRLAVGIDLSQAITMFPGLRLGNFTGCTHKNGVCRNGEFYNHSMTIIRDVIQKCALMMGCCRNVMFTLHKAPELGPPDAAVRAEITATVQRLVTEAAGLTPNPVTLHLRQSSKNDFVAGNSASAQFSWTRSAGFPSNSLMFAPNTGLAAFESTNLSAPGMLTEKSMLLLDGVSELYLSTRHGTETPAVVKTRAKELKQITRSIALAQKANTTIVLDATYFSMLEEEGDVLFLENTLRRS